MLIHIPELRHPKHSNLSPTTLHSRFYTLKQLPLVSLRLALPAFSLALTSACHGATLDRGVRAATGIEAVRRHSRSSRRRGLSEEPNQRVAGTVDESVDGTVDITVAGTRTVDGTVRGRRLLAVEGVYVDLILSVPPTAATTAAAGLAAIVASTSFRNFLDLGRVVHPRPSPVAQCKSPKKVYPHCVGSLL